ncbi:hypothetical protein CROQUDRAFT_722285 [Cronartium quercuum f. sp. fusiforme G11]|uniref:HTH APSES-type domain-containing protein n=1 Tax=Cronartium quercuum f. sp. fusiforme G11 TaxID=708437 RepID=A0A9P6TDB4_9BASI|nr:hypothetical protein CROQUDRAFT_722285 [Cronartium quercuum f. sp. fusiforme G11]
MATASTPTFSAPMSIQPPRTVHALVNEEAKAAPPVRLYPSQHRVSMTRYATSTDPRGYIPVFEYPLNGQYIMIDCETGMVHFTGIWKALGHTKADVVKLVESDPTIAPYLRKVRGGYLKIQGTWLPFDTARTLARRVAWQIRYELIPLFGPEFPDTCLGPGEPGFGQLLLSAPKPRGRRGAKKAASAVENSRSKALPASQGHLGTALPYSYPSPDLSAPRQPTHGHYRSEGLGPVPVYTSHVPQARYSPYTRVPSHGITQLEPLPSLVQPHQARPPLPQCDSMYGPSHPYQNPGTRNSLGSTAEPMGSPFNGYFPPGSTVRSSSVHMHNPHQLPSMRNIEQQPTSGNFFETYRGPDSFEALSNRWLGSEPGGCVGTGLSDNTLNGDTHGARRISSTPTMMSGRRDGPSNPMDQYSFPEHMHSVSQQRQNYPNQNCERGLSYHFDQTYESEFSSGLMPEGVNRRPSSAPDYAPNGIYDPTYSSDAQNHPQTQNGDEVNACTNGLMGSPNSHSSHVATGTTPKSPSPSSASTSTHLHHSHHRHSHRSSQHTLGGFSSTGNINGPPGQADDVNQFSVLTSPAHIEIGVASPGKFSNTLNHSESEWNTTRSTACVSPKHTLSN